MNKIISVSISFILLTLSASAFAQQNFQESKRDYDIYGELGAGLGDLKMSADSITLSVPHFRGTLGIGGRKYFGDNKKYFIGADARYHYLASRNYGTDHTVDGSITAGMNLNEKLFVFARGGAEQLFSIHKTAPLVGAGLGCRLRPELTLIAEFDHTFIPAIESSYTDKEITGSMSSLNFGLQYNL